MGPLVWKRGEIVKKKFWEKIGENGPFTSMGDLV